MGQLGCVGPCLRTKQCKTNKIAGVTQGGLMGLALALSSQEAGPGPGVQGRVVIMTLLAGDMDFTMIRLVNGSGPHQGRVEVFHDRRWGTVCDDGWDKKDGDVVCRMLGFHGVEEVYRTARFGQGKDDEVRYRLDNMEENHGC